MALSKNELIDNAQRYVQKGQLDKAIKEYQQVLQLDGGDIQIRLRLGDVFTKKGAAREAIEQYVRVADRHANDGFYLKAIAVHKQILKLDPNFIESTSRLADLYRQQGLVSEAIATYQQVAAVYDRKGDVRAALDTLTKMADLDANNVAIRIKLGEMYLKASIRESGIEQLLKAAELLGTAGKQAEQIQVLDKILAAAPASGSANRAVLAMLIEAGQVEPAVKRLNALIAKAPEDADLRDLQAAAFVKAGRTGEAVKALETLLAAAPHRAASRQRLVALHLETGDTAAAVAAAAGFAPDSLPPGKLDEAVAAARALAEREPPPPPEVRAALQRALVGLCTTRKDEAGRQAAQAALASALAETGAADTATADLSSTPGDFLGGPGEPVGATPTSVDFGALLLDDAPAGPRAAPAGPRAAPAAELSIEIEVDEPAPLDAPAGARPGPGATATVDSGAFDLDPLGLSLDLDLPAEPGNAARAPAATMELSIDVPLDRVGALDAAAPRSPETDVLAASNAELSLDQIPEELDEAEFFVHQGLHEAARAIYKRILAVDPGHPQARAALEALEKERTGPHTPQAPTRFPPSGDHPASATPADADTFDLAAVLAGPVVGQAGALLADAEEQVSFQEVFREFKKGVERQVGDDPEVHYDLGIAYKEMGLVDDAISEFERALADPARRFECYTMIGLCQIQRGDPESAVMAFQLGLDDEGIKRGQAVALNYELGLAYEAAGRADDARAAFAKVAERDPTFRDVAAKLGGAPGGFDPQSLVPDEARHGADRATPGRGARPAPRPRDKISFV